MFIGALQVEVNIQGQRQHVDHRLFNIVFQIAKRIVNRKNIGKTQFE